MPVAISGVGPSPRETFSRHEVSDTYFHLLGQLKKPLSVFRITLARGQCYIPWERGVDVFEIESMDNFTPMEWTKT